MGGVRNKKPSAGTKPAAAATSSTVRPRVKWGEEDSAPSAPQLRAVDKAAQAAQLAAQLAENEDALEIEDDLEAEEIEDDMW